MRKIFLLILLFTENYLCLFAQQSGMVVNSFLELPISAHAAALGGNNVTYFGDDASFAYSNPALLGVEHNKQLDFSYAFYMAGTGYGSGLYAMAFSEEDAFQAGFQFAQYGKMDGYDEVGNSVGTFSALDFSLTATYSRQLNKYFSVGATVKPILSTYETYTYFSVGVDFGAQFYDEKNLLSVGLAVQNLGGQLAGPDDELLSSKLLPINVSLGVSKRVKHAPFCFHVTLQNLQKWNYNYASNSSEEEIGTVNAGVVIARKLIIGVDVVPKSDNFWISIAYNFDRGLSLDNPYVFSVAGLSAGGGFRTKMMRIGAGVAFYHTSAITAHLSVGMDLSWFNKKKL